MALALSGRVALATAGVGALGGFLGGWVADASNDARAGAAVQLVVVLVAVAVACGLLVRRAVLVMHRAPLRTSAVLGVVLGYLADPWAWSALGVGTAGWLGAGVAAWSIDLAGWVGAGCASVLAASRGAARAREQLGYLR